MIADLISVKTNARGKAIAANSAITPIDIPDSEGGLDISQIKTVNATVANGHVFNK